MTDIPVPAWQEIELADLVPHSRSMFLLDRLLAYDRNAVTAQARVRPENPFFIPGRGIPVCIGFEYMAQTMAAFAGLDARSKGAPVKLGMLVGCRKAACGASWFTEGQVLDITAKLEWESEGMAVFSSSIADHETGTTLLAGKVNVYQPDDLQAFLKNSGLA